MAAVLNLRELGKYMCTPVALDCPRTEPHFFLLFMPWSILEEASVNICRKNSAAVKQKLHVDTFG